MSDDNSTHVNDARVFDSSPLSEEELREKTARATGLPFGLEHVGPLILDPLAGQLTPKIEQTAQDRGEPSPVPYSIFIKSPAVDTEEQGIERYTLSVAVSDLSSCHTDKLVPVDCRPWVEAARMAFRRGYYRFELIVGDWSIRIYKHPNNP